MNTLFTLLPGLLIAAAPPQETARDEEEAARLYEEACVCVEKGRTTEALDRLGRALDAGLKNGSEVYVAPALFPLRDEPAFRELLAEKAAFSRLRLVPRDEPGTPLELTARVRAVGDGAPIPKARVYLYHTDAHGLYRADEETKPPRIFGHLVTDEKGRFSIVTIRPASYPDSRVSQHIHFRVDAEGFAPLQSEVLFADDPFLRRDRGDTGREVVAEPKAGEDGVHRAEIEIRLRRNGSD